MARDKRYFVTDFLAVARVQRLLAPVYTMQDPLVPFLPYSLHFNNVVVVPVYRSTSPKTKSMVPMIATASAIK